MATALGGGYLALFGSHTLYSYASSVDEIATAFTRSTKVDISQLADDSGNRGEYWANYATSIGASTHELGHCFGAPHTPTGIMARGFDNFNRFFMVSEPNSDDVCIGTHELGAFWHDDTIKILLAGKHFKPAKKIQNGKWLNVGVRTMKAEQFFVETEDEFEAVETGNANNNSRTQCILWESKAMSMKKSNTEWHEIELLHNQIRFTFEEVEYKPKENTVIVYDKSRQMFVKIGPENAAFAMATSLEKVHGHWHVFVTGHWKN